MIFNFRNRTIFGNISKWNKGQRNWDRGRIYLIQKLIKNSKPSSQISFSKRKKKKKKVHITYGKGC